jgi:hypothetical protein
VIVGGLLSWILIAAVSAIIASQADADTIGSNLRSLGIPTSSSEWGDIGTLAGIASLAAMLLGALVGGVLGERWHTKLARRAVSGKYSPDDSQRQAGDERTNATPSPRPDDRDQAAPGQSERDRSGGSGATRVD